MEPLLPEQGRNVLSELTCRILQAAGRVTGQVHAPMVRVKIAELVQEMNCYYSNLIEGHKTQPRDIERALRNDFSSSPKRRDNQRLSVAHIEVERLIPAELGREGVSPYSPDFICWLHREFYSRLPEEFHFAQTKSGRKYEVKPGLLREYMVDVGGHTPPVFKAIPEMLQRFSRFYGSERILPTNRLVAIAAAHHRLAWIHPFGDGNGRVARLHSQALLIHHGLDGGGFWTISRGLARDQSKYYDLLSNADQVRRHDFDGRGNLSDSALSEFCQFFLSTMLDQIEFMGGLLDLPSLRERIERYFRFEALDITKHREELMKVVKVLVDEGEISRSRVLDITGRSGAVGAAIIKQGLERELFSSPSPKGELQVRFSSKYRNFFFPKLFFDQVMGKAS